MFYILVTQLNIQPIVILRLSPCLIKKIRKQLKRKLVFNWTIDLLN